MRRRRTTAGWLCIAGAGVCAWALSDDCEAHRRYWKALNEGRPVNRIQSIVEQLVFPALRKKNQDELIQEAARALSSIEKCAPEGSVLGGVYLAPAVDDHAVYTGSWDGHYYALDPNDGHVLWAWSPPGWPYQAGGRPDSGAPAVVGDKVIVPALGSRFVALEAHTGTKVWEWVAPPWRIANVTPAAAMGLVWVSVFGNAYEWPFGAHLYALDAQTGQMLWDLPDAGGLAAPVVAKDGLLLCGSLSRPFLSAYQMDLRRNQRPVLLWRLQTGGVTMESHPALSGDLGFFLTQDGWLRAIR